MTAVTPVASSNVAAFQPVEAAVSVPSNGINAEQRLMEYVARFQAEGLMKGQQLGNPAALSGEALKALKGYFERATALQDSASRKARVMSDLGNDLTAKGEGQQVATLPGGPARERLEPALSRTDAPAGRAERITDADLNKTVDTLLEVLRYSMETGMITTATGNISKSATTLTRGQ